MRLSAVQKKLLNKALYTSPLMAVPSISPIIIRNDVPFEVFFYAVAVQSVVVFCLWAINIGLFSFSFGKSEQQNKFWRYFISYSLAIAIILLVREALLWWASHHFSPVGEDAYINKTRNEIPYYGLVLSFSINSVILIIQDVITIKEKKAIADLENSQLKLKNAEIINQELKQQIHPHFLFNALNTLKTLIHKQPYQAEDYLIRLSNFLRISISTTKANTVKLSQELSLCVDYLEMQKTRFGNTLKYEIDIPKERSETGYVPIFSIQLLLENVIKHNAMYRDAPLWIEVVYDADEDRVKVINNRKKRETQELSTRLGLDNLAERYRILSGDRVIIQASEERFSVSIKVLNHEGSHYRGRTING